MVETPEQPEPGNKQPHTRRIQQMTDSKKKAQPPKGVTIPVDPVLIALADNMLTIEEIKAAVESGKKAREEVNAENKAVKKK
jgi:hypothetical protein